MQTIVKFNIWKINVPKLIPSFSILDILRRYLSDEDNDQGDSQSINRNGFSECHTQDHVRLDDTGCIGIASHGLHTTGGSQSDTYTSTNGTQHRQASSQ